MWSVCPATPAGVPPSLHTRLHPLFLRQAAAFPRTSPSSPPAGAPTPPDPQLLQGAAAGLVAPLLVSYLGILSFFCTVRPCFFSSAVVRQRICAASNSFLTFLHGFEIGIPAGWWGWPLTSSRIVLEGSCTDGTARLIFAELCRRGY